MQRLGVLFQQGVGHVVDLPLGLGGLGGVGNAQGQDHLVLPQGNGVYQGGLDLFHHDGVVVLDHPDLGSRLDGNGPGQLQVVDFLFEPVALLRQVSGRLGVLGQARPLGGGLQLLQFPVPDLLELLLSGQDIHGQLLEVGQILVVHFVQHGGVFQKPDLVLLQGGADLLYVHFRLGVFAFHDLQFVGLLLEKAEEALFFFLVQAFQLTHDVYQQVAYLAQVLGADVGKSGVGEVRHLLLGARAVLQDLVGVFNVDLSGKVGHHFLLGRGEHRLGDGRLFYGGRGCLLGGGQVQFRLQGQAGGLDFFKVHVGILLISGRSRCRLSPPGPAAY